MIVRENQSQQKENATFEAACTRSRMFAGDCGPEAIPDCTATQVVIPRQDTGAQGE